MADDRREEQGRCPDCGHAATLVWARVGVGEAGVQTERGPLVACVNRACRHYAPPPIVGPLQQR